MTRTRILLVDDEPGIRLGMRGFLTAHGFDVDEATSLAEAQEAFRTTRPDVAVVDYRLTDGTALELLPRLKEIDASVPLVVLTGHGSIELAVQAVKEGAEQFLTKPVELAVLKVVLDRLVAQRRERQRLLAERSRASRGAVEPFVGSSAAIRALQAQAERIIESDSPVLITGETGSGKSVLARWLHEGGPRKDAPFVDLNCAALSKDLLDSELFGHEKGAFTGAVAAKQGLLEVADRGTLFLDEIGDMDSAVQPKLLKVLEEKRFRRLGDVRDRRVDVRLIAATHQDLGAAAREKRFRSDLYFRVSTLILHVPRCVSGPRTSSGSRTTSWRRWARCVAAAAWGCNPTRRPPSPATPGPATSASCATCWSAPSCCPGAGRCPEETCASRPAPARPPRTPTTTSPWRSWSAATSSASSAASTATWSAPPRGSASPAPPSMSG